VQADLDDGGDVQSRTFGIHVPGGGGVAVVSGHSGRVVVGARELKRGERASRPSPQVQGLLESGSSEVERPYGHLFPKPGVVVRREGGREKTVTGMANDQHW